MVNNITRKKIEKWLKSDHTNEINVDNAIEVIYALASGQYTIKRLQEDINAK